MSAEPEDLVFDLGPQNDGEPVAVATVADPTPEPPAEPEAAAPEVAEEAIDDGPEAELQDETETHKKKSGSQRWKEKAQREAEEKEYWRQQALKGQAPEAPKPQPAPNGKPVLDSYETFDAYNEALMDWKVEQRMAQMEQKTHAEKIQKTWEAKKAEARKELPDFDEVISDMIEPPAPVVLAVMEASDHIAKIAYHLAQHPDELQRINRLAPPQAALEVARIEARFNRTPAPAASKPVSKAPRPPSPVSAPSAPRPSDDGRIELY